MFSQSICDEDQLLGFQAAARVRENLAKRDRTLRLHTQTEGQVNCKKKTQMGKTCALTHHCTAVVSETLTQAITPDKLQQITCRQAPRHQSLIHDSHWVPCRIPSQISCPHQFDVMNMFPMSRSDVDNLRKDECLQLMEQLGEPQPRRRVLVKALKAMIKDMLFSDEDGQEQPLLGLAKMNRSPLADKARKLNIPTAESHTKGHSIRLKRENTCSSRHQWDRIIWNSASMEPRRIRRS